MSDSDTNGLGRYIALAAEGRHAAADFQNVSAEDAGREFDSRSFKLFEFADKFFGHNHSLGIGGCSYPCHSTQVQRSRACLKSRPSPIPSRSGTIPLLTYAPSSRAF